ncbi:ATP-binding protein [Cognatishimia sp. WU-CL00825]|uniref:response regulator n=1 Tax=Cognatishimia sp. WU-CL00825 TaxID=3127658 RepID=UPI0031037E9D
MYTRSGIRTGFFVVILAIVLFQITVLALTVFRQIENLSTARSDNVLWTFSQSEVDFRRFTTTLANAKSNPGAAQEIREDFDIFFSRIVTLRDSSSYAANRQQPEFTQNLFPILEFLDQSIAIIDAPDEVLDVGLDDIFAQAMRIEPNVRQLALTGLGTSSQDSDMQRADMRNLLLRLTLVTVLLILGLIALVIFLRRLYQRSQTISDDNRRARAWLQSMVETSLDGIVVADGAGNIVELNETAKRIFQLDHVDTAHFHMSALILGARGDGAFDRPENSGLTQAGRTQTFGRRPDGSQFPIEIALSSTRTIERDKVYVAYIRDISDRLAAEKELLLARDKAQAGEKAKANLLAVMSHEIRTPLSGILGTAQLLHKTELTQKQAALLDAMQTSGDLLMHHVNDILDLSKLDANATSLVLGPIELRPLMQNLVDSQRANAENSGNTIDLSVSDTVPNSVIGDANKIQQAMLNLIGNAIKFTTNGTIAVEVDHFGQADLIEFRVIDSGVGILECELDNIFDDFFVIDTTYASQQQGSGLGLGITRRLVEKMSGQIGAESIKNEGSLFWLRLPLPICLASDLADEGKKQAQEKPISLSILLVEDNDINRLITGEMLQNEGHDVSLASSGHSGISKAAQSKYDLILMDIRMPGMDGIAAAQEIRSGTGASQASPIIALTAQTLPSEIARIKKAGMDEVLTKPITSDALNTVLSQIAQSDSPLEDARNPKYDATKTLRLDILSDVVRNIGMESTKHHHVSLRAQVAALLSAKSVDAPTPTNMQPQIHSLCGASAILGLCEFHNQLSKAENRELSPAHPDWQHWVVQTRSIWNVTDHALERFLEGKSGETQTSSKQ